jgi:hypothetical protein
MTADIVLTGFSGIVAIRLGWVHNTAAWVGTASCQARSNGMTEGSMVQLGGALPAAHPLPIPTTVRRPIAIAAHMHVSINPLLRLP